MKVAWSCLTFCNSVDCIVHGILQARILEWVTFPFSGGSSQPRDQTQVFHIAGGFFTSWATRGAQPNMLVSHVLMTIFAGQTFQVLSSQITCDFLLLKLLLFLYNGTIFEEYLCSPIFNFFFLVNSKTLNLPLWEPRFILRNLRVSWDTYKEKAHRLLNQRAWV